MKVMRRVLRSLWWGVVFVGSFWGLSAEMEAPGLFMSRERLAKLKEGPSAVSAEVWAARESFLRRADSMLSKTADPFRMEDVRAIRFGWCGKPEGEDDTLKELTQKLDVQSDWIRNAALGFALTGKSEYAKQAETLLMAWVEESSLVNLYDFEIDFENGRLLGMTDDGFCGDRPWNFTLDVMWQAYGLINVSDAYLFLSRNGYTFEEDNQAAILAWIRELAEAVNSSFHAWTRWADYHVSSSSYDRYRSDNHLSWSLAGLMAAAVALGDDALAKYVLEGGEWEDSRAGVYANPSSIRTLIDLAIEGAKKGEDSLGRVYEERILRKPPVRYSLFHLWPMTLVALMAEEHFDDDLWAYEGEDGAGLEDAYRRYAAYVKGARNSPKPGQEGEREEYAWLYEIATVQWDDPIFEEARDLGKRGKQMRQSIGPVTLLLGE